MTVIVFLIVLLGSIAIGMPIAFALLLSAVAMMVQLDMFDSQILAQNLINGTDSFPLMAVPFFMLAGVVMNVGGLSKRIVNLAMAMVGHVRGGLGYVAILASVILASLSGSAVADAAALGALLVPMMIASGHNKGRSCGLIAAGGIIGPIIPPSIGFIIFGVSTNTSISKLFLAGIFPGILLGLSLVLAWWWVVRTENIEPPPQKSRQEVITAFKEGVWALFLPFIIIFGLKFGIFTPTEAGCVAAVYSLFVAIVVYRELQWHAIFHVFVTAAKTTSVVMFLVGAAMVSAWLVTVADVPGQLAAVLQPFLDSPLLLMVLIMGVIVIAGMFMDMTPNILILAPVLMPLVQQAGIDPVYFGVLFVINTSIGLITPPVGTVLNVVSAVGKIQLGELVVGVWPFLVAEVIVLALMILFPALVTVPAHWFY